MPSDRPRQGARPAPFHSPRAQRVQRYPPRAMPKISVVVPSYNHERFVGATVASVLAQTLTDLEIIAVDDASTDASVAVLDAVRDPRFRYVVHRENLGPSAALNTGIRLARGEYVAICDSDDMFLPGKLARQVSLLDAKPAVGAVFSLPEIIDESGAAASGDAIAGTAAIFDQRNRSRHAWLAHFFDRGNCLCHPSSVMRRSLFHELGWYDERLARLQDFDLWLRLLRRHEIFVVQEKLTRYRWLASGGKLSSTRDPGHVSRTVWEITHLLRHYLGLDVADIEAMFGAEVVAHYRELGLAPDFMVIDIAAQRPQPAYHLFALEALYDLLPPSGSAGPWHRHLMALAASLDPMNIKTTQHLRQQLAAQAQVGRTAPLMPGLNLTFKHRP
jgi:glycosyltransferase involved in cell wall biosynthesis